MSRDCFDPGTLQAFLDGETAPGLSTRISDHVLECDECAIGLARAEEESALVFSVLDREFNALVPTQRLWSRINESIETERGGSSVWTRLYSFVSVYLLSPSLTAAAAMLLFVGIAAFVLTSNVEEPAGDIALNDRPAAASQTSSREALPAPVVSSVPDTVVSEATLPTSSARPPQRAGVINASAADRVRTPRGLNTSPVRASTLVYIPGEESYIRTIAELDQQVESQKDRVLPVASRVAFERDLAVVNDAIKRTKDTIKKNPDNQAARQVLYAAYQDKIDLLNSVGQREELMASLR